MGGRELGEYPLKFDIISACLGRNHGFHTVQQKIGPGGLLAPCVLACAMRSLAIVITIVQSFLFFSFLFSPSSTFHPLRGISRVRKCVSPNILAYLEIYAKKNIVLK